MPAGNARAATTLFVKSRRISLSDSATWSLSTRDLRITSASRTQPHSSVNRSKVSDAGTSGPNIFVLKVAWTSRRLAPSATAPSAATGVPE